jgi:hypothetical protein
MYSLTTKRNFPREKVCPKRKQFVYECLNHICGSEEKTDTVLRILASAMKGINATQYMRFYCFYGSGANGKSMLTDLLARAFGDFYCKAETSEFTQKRARSDSCNPSLATLIGKRFACMAELEVGEQINIATLKAMTGDEVMGYRGLYQPTRVETTITFTPFLTSNETTQLKIEDYAVKRRFVYIWLKNRYMPRQDIKNEFPEWDGSVKNLPANVFIRDDNLKKDLCDNYVDEFIELLLDHLDVEDKELQLCSEVVDDTNQLLCDKDTLLEALKEMYEYDPAVYTEYNPTGKYRHRPPPRPARPQGITADEVMKQLKTEDLNLFTALKKEYVTKKDFINAIKMRMPKGIQLTQRHKDSPVFYKNIHGDEKAGVCVFLHIKEKESVEDSEENTGGVCVFDNSAL